MMGWLLPRLPILALFIASPLPSVADEFLILPTPNRALYSGNYPAYYMYTDRNFEGRVYKPWQGGKYGHVRTPIRSGGEIVYTRFHEGMDIQPVQRDNRGNPVDKVWSVAPGVVVHVSPLAGASTYGKYVVVEHDFTSGKFYSLYAHLMTIDVAPGDVLRAGTILGRLGFTGAGINQTRAHLHLEIAMKLHQEFDAWYASQYVEPNRHGPYSGFNLEGIDVADFYLAQRSNPRLLIKDYISACRPYFKVVVPKAGSRFDMIHRYPWLLKSDSSNLPSWELTFADSGIPLSVEGSNTVVAQPEVSWVQTSSVAHRYPTRGRLTGSGASAKLTAAGERFIALLTGRF